MGEVSHLGLTRPAGTRKSNESIENADGLHTERQTAEGLLQVVPVEVRGCHGGSFLLERMTNCSTDAAPAACQTTSTD